MIHPHLAKAGYLIGLAVVMTVGCASRHTVRVIDAGTQLPIQGAWVVPVYPSIGGAGSPGYVTDETGVATIGGFGLPQGGYGVYVSAPGYYTNFIGTSGWRGNHLEVDLGKKPVPSMLSPDRTFDWPLP